MSRQYSQYSSEEEAARRQPTDDEVVEKVEHVSRDVYHTDAADQAKSKAEEAVDQAKLKAKEAAEQARRKVEEVTEQARRKAWPLSEVRVHTEEPRVALFELIDTYTMRAATETTQPTHRQVLAEKVTFSPQAWAVIRQLAEATGNSEDEVLQKAIALMDVVVNAERQGYKAGLADPRTRLLLQEFALDK